MDYLWESSIGMPATTIDLSGDALTLFQLVRAIHALA